MSVSVEIGHAHSMTEKSANMIRVKQPPRVTIGEGLTPPDALQPKHRSGEEHEKANVDCQRIGHGGETNLTRWCAHWQLEVAGKVFYKIVNFIDKHNGLQCK